MSRAAARDRERRRKHRRRKHRERAGRASGWWAAAVAVPDGDGGVYLTHTARALARDPDRALVRAGAAAAHAARTLGPPPPRLRLHTLPVTDAAADTIAAELHAAARQDPDPAMRRAAAAGLGLDAEAEALPVPPILRAQRVRRDAHCRPARPVAVAVPWETP